LWCGEYFVDGKKSEVLASSVNSCKGEINNAKEHDKPVKFQLLFLGKKLAYGVNRGDRRVLSFGGSASSTNWRKDILKSYFWGQNKGNGSKVSLGMRVLGYSQQKKNKKTPTHPPKVCSIVKL